MTRRWKASRLIYRVDKLWGGYNSSRRLSERLERTATSTREGNARGRPSDIAQEALGSRSVSKAMECAWRGSSGRRGRVGRSLGIAQIESSVLLLQGDEAGGGREAIRMATFCALSTSRMAPGAARGGGTGRLLE